MNCSDVILISQKNGGYKISPFFIYSSKRYKKDEKVMISIEDKPTSIEMVLRKNERSPLFQSDLEDLIIDYQNLENDKKEKNSENSENSPNVKKKKISFKKKKKDGGLESPLIEKNEIKFNEVSKKMIFQMFDSVCGVEGVLNEKYKNKNKIRRKIAEKFDDIFYPVEFITPNNDHVKEILKFFKTNDDEKQLPNVSSKKITFKCENQETDGDIYLINESDKNKIIISDIDGTITKSDKTGLLKTYVMEKYDYTHEGICSLFTKIQKKGYSFIFFSCRSVRMCEKTRKYLKNVEQDGFKLPSGPIITIMSNYKSAVAIPVFKLEDIYKKESLNLIKDLFSTENPFHSGFGNTERDNVSYKNTNMKNSFIINKKGLIKLNDKIITENGYKDIEKKIEEYF